MTIQATAGSETQVTGGGTGNFRDITMLSDGGWLFTYNSGYDIYQQRFGADGAAISGAQLVNATTQSSQDEPSVAMLDDGGWIVTWMSMHLNTPDVFQQRFASDGTPVGGEVLVNTRTVNNQQFSTVAGLADGGWIVTWSDFGQDGAGYGIYQQRFDLNGVAVGSETRVNTATGANELLQHVAGLRSGGWVVVWFSDNQDGGGYGVYLQRFSADGSPVGVEELVNKIETGDQYMPRVTALVGGGFLVTWQSNGQDGSGLGVYMRRFGADGSFLGLEERVNTTVAGAQEYPDVAGLADGGWVVVWQSQDASGADIYLQRYAADGTAIGGETLVNDAVATTTPHPKVTALANGGWVVSWKSLSGLVTRWYAPDIDGTAADDTISGTVLGELMRGLAGDDVYQVNSIYDVVEEDANDGTDTVRASVSFTLGDNVEHLVLTGSANIDATGNDLDNRLTGNTGDNLLRGMAGDDTLDGQAGADTMEGGTGNDTYYVDDVGDIVRETASAGTDTVRAALSYALSAHVENLVLTGTANIDATGNGLANRLTGNSGDNVLNGAAGADTMIGGAGDDTYYVDNAGDVVTERSGGGHDTVDASVSHTLAAYVEDLVLIGSASINGTGNGLANMIVGNAGNNVLNGGGGADTMLGRTGNDTYYVDNAGDIVVEAANAGTDTVRASRSYTLGSNVENLVLTGTGNLSGTGNSLANVITGNTGNNTLSGGSGNDTLRGSNGNDSLLGGTGNDRLEGGSGNDRLTGGAGSDKLYGGTGADRFVFTSLSDSTVASSGRDTIYDFSRSQGDRIDLSALDASTKSSGNQAFTFIGEKTAFTGKAGELRYINSGGDTYVYGDVNGDRKSDFAIKIDANIDLVKGDFIL
ncbi:calcium-binding protein [Ciceribacter sp. L1K22]|uniref:calcium-binding protein n=1 Tax=Ciceribacter sp. L1K22 TaxID=2820275 RepID=UPI001ABE9FB2|nr:calcium-binding protein [Ciceribacter sp. L1K22]MBO3762537.1 calcium-binding protein [Ciceribacter sp. L1K22]